MLIQTSANCKNYKTIVADGFHGGVTIHGILGVTSRPPFDKRSEYGEIFTINSLGLTASAGIGVAEKVCGFIMLIPAAFMQAMAAFSAQNIGAGKYQRAKRALLYAIGVSTALAVVMFAVTFWRGDLLSSVFSNDPAVITAAADYLKAYAIDCLQTCFLFCFIGFFNGLGMTRFVMLQGVIGAFLIRIPVAFLMSREVPVSMFHIGLATPCSTVLQVIMCLVCFWITDRKYKNRLDNEVSAV